MLKILHKIYQRFALPTYVIKEARNKEGVDGRIVTFADSSSHIAEEFKMLRTNLYFLSPEKHLKTITITSSQLEEGKTIIASNLAAVLSLDTEKKTLLIDADLRKPKIHTLFGIPQKPGLCDILKGSTPFEYFLKKPAVENLYIIPSGASMDNPSQILASTKIGELLEHLKARFDYIILDTPPALNVADAGIFGSLCDAVFLVVKAGVTPRNMIEEGFNLLKDAQAQPKACILNDVPVPLNYFLTKYEKYYG